jgi:hypothetical protein
MGVDSFLAPIAAYSTMLVPPSFKLDERFDQVERDVVCRMLMVGI